MQIVIDTNVLVSGIFWRGIPGEIVMAWTKGKFSIAANQAILDEYFYVIEHLVKKYKSIDPKPIINMLMLKSKLHQTLEFESPVCRDSDDDKFIACAIVANINIIISGDKDLLGCADLPSGIQVLKPGDFCKKLNLLPSH